MKGCVELGLEEMSRITGGFPSCEGRSPRRDRPEKKEQKEESRGA